MADATDMPMRSLVLKVVWTMVLTMVSNAVRADTIHFDDPFAAQQYYLSQMRFDAAWTTLYQQPVLGSVTVAVLDSGFETAHSDLNENLLGGINIVDGSSNIAPVHPHGTATSGLPGARSGNAEGISQAAWTAQVMPVRVSNRRDGAAYLTDLAAGIRHAADSGARVINVSYGGVQTRILARAAAYAYRRGAITFMAAGNDGRLHNWNNHKHLIAVGAVDRNSNQASFSSYGRFVDFAAAGVDVTTLTTNDSYANWSGTSFSSPLAASVAALVLIANPDLSPAQVLKILKRTAIDLGTAGKDQQYGQGLLDAGAAVDLALQTLGRWKGAAAGGAPDRKASDVFRDYRGLIAGADELVLPQGWLSGLGYSVPSESGEVPEPASAALLLVGALWLLGRPRRNNAPYHCS